METDRNFDSSDNWKHITEETLKNEEFILRVKTLIKSREALKKENLMLKDKIKVIEKGYVDVNSKLESVSEERANLKSQVVQLESLLSKYKYNENTNLENRIEELTNGFMKSNELMYKIAEEISDIKKDWEVYQQPQNVCQSSAHPLAYDDSNHMSMQYGGEHRKEEDRIFQKKGDNRSNPQSEYEIIRKDLNNILISMNKRLRMVEESVHIPHYKKNVR